MIGRALDSNNDLIVENGAFKLVQNGSEVVQHVRSRLLFYKNEWFLDRSAGVPYFEEVFVKPSRPDNVESILKSEILQTPGVLSLIEFTMDYDSQTRKLTVTFTAETTYGLIEGETINV